MQRDPFGEKIICFLCDYGLVFLAVLFVLLFAAWWLLSGGLPAPATPPGVVTPGLPFATDTPDVLPGITTTPDAPGSTDTPVATPEPTALPTGKPEFILVFVAVRWQSGDAAFEQAADGHAQTFIDESNMDAFFTIKTVYLTEGLPDASLSDPNLDYAVYQYGLVNEPGDRYIGLTDGDLALDGDPSVAGWTSGGQAVIVEASEYQVTAHELGHTFGLCDEYSYSEWLLQDEYAPGGCPNPYPSTCPQTLSGGITCDGAPTSDGRNSIMGPAGLYGAYGFNEACLNSLQETFQSLAAQVSQ